MTARGAVGQKERGLPIHTEFFHAEERRFRAIGGIVRSEEVFEQGNRLSYLLSMTGILPVSGKKG
jgi:hypothetical protein